MIIRFTSLNETYLIKADDFIFFIDNKKKSIMDLDYIKEKGYIIKEKLLKRLDYLEIVDKIWRLL